MTRLMSEREVQEKLGIPARTLQAWRMRGGGPPFVKLAKRCVRYREGDLQGWLDAHLCDPARAARDESGE